MIGWRDDKNRINIREHGIPLSAAATLFEGPFTEDLDLRFEYGEERIVAAGMLRGRVFICVYTWRLSPAGSLIRWIISLRPASKKEINDYYEDQHIG